MKEYKYVCDGCSTRCKVACGDTDGFDEYEIPDKCLFTDGFGSNWKPVPDLAELISQKTEVEQELLDNRTSWATAEDIYNKERDSILGRLITVNQQIQEAENETA